MKYGIDKGHTLSGADTGAEGNGKREQDLTREVGSLVNNKLRSLGHTVIECEKDNCSSLIESLSYRVNTANNNNVDLYVSIHFNAGGGRGTEVYTYGGKHFPEADNVLNEIVALGFNNRGIKDGSHLYVIRNTKARAMLIECCFIDTDDMNKYNAENFANAIVKGLTGQTVVNKQVVEEDPIMFGVVTASALNVRDGAGTNYNKLGVIANGTKVKIDKRYSKPGWYSIYYGDHGGFVSADYIKLV